MHADMEGYSVPVAISELIDNAVRADANQITVQCGSSGHANNRDEIDIIRCHDTGVRLMQALAHGWGRDLVEAFSQPDAIKTQREAAQCIPSSCWHAHTQQSSNTTI